MPNQALEQTRDSVLRYGEVVGCELLNVFVIPQEVHLDGKRLAMRPQPVSAIATSFVLMLAVTVGFGAFQKHWTLQRAREVAARSPLKWNPFSRQRLHEVLKEGRPVLVMYFWHWKPRPLWRLDTEEVRVAIYDKRIELMNGNSHLESLRPSGIDEARAEVGEKSDWFGAIYYPDSSIATFQWIPDAKEFAKVAAETIRRR